MYSKICWITPFRWTPAVIGCFVFLIGVVHAPGGTLSREWDEVWGESGQNDVAYGITLDYSGNLYVGGYSKGYSTHRTNYLAKMQISDHSILWSKTWGRDGDCVRGVAVDPAISKTYSAVRTSRLVGSTSYGRQQLTTYSLTGDTPVNGLVWGADYDNTVNGVVFDKNNAVGYVVATTVGSIDGQGGLNGTDICLTKFDNGLVRKWSKLLGGYYGEEGTGVAVDGVGSVYVVGYSSQAFGGYTITNWTFRGTSGTKTAGLFKYSSDGELIWARLWCDTTGWVKPAAVTVDSDNHVYVTGTSGRDDSGDEYANNNDLFLTKYDTEGNYYWTQTRGSTTASDRPQAVTTTDDGKIYVIGHTYGSIDGAPYRGGADPFAAVFSEDGTWKTTYMWGSMANDYAWSATSDGTGVYVCGSANGSFDSDILIDYSEIFVSKLAYTEQTPLIFKSQTAFSASCQQGQNAADQTFEIWNGGDGTLSYSIANNANWFTVSPASGISDSERNTHSVSYSTSGLSTGVYNGTIIITASDADNTPQIMPVTLTVDSSPETKNVVAWGNNNNGQANVPSGLSTVVAVSAGQAHSLALRANGTVAAWGQDYYGHTALPPEASNVMAISAGSGHSLALRANGTVEAWGYGLSGRTNVPIGLSNVVAVSAGGAHSLALRANGTVEAWGEYYNGSAYVPMYVPEGLSNVVAVSAGQAHSLALRADGSIIAWGGDSRYNDTNVSVGLSNVVAIGAGPTGYHSLALHADGTVEAFGDNTYGQNAPAGLSNVAALGTGAAGFHSLALIRNGTVAAWGYGANGQTNVPPGLSNIVAVAAGGTHSLALIGVGKPFLAPMVNQIKTSVGGKVFLRAQPAGALPMSCRWQKDGAPLAGATNAVLKLSVTSTDQYGAYRCIVSNSQGVATGTVVQVSGDPAPIQSPAIAKSVTSLSPSCQQGQNAGNQTFEIRNSGEGILTYSISDDANWLTVSPTNRTSTGENNTHIVSYNTSGLSTGTYTGTITISAPSATNTPQTITVTLTVTPVTGYTYTTASGKISITGYAASGGEITIPSTINGLPVTSIGDYAFAYHTNLTLITIPSSVVSIGSGAFQNCPGLTNVVVGSGIASLGNYVFQGCRDLSAITVDELNASFSSVDGVLFNKSRTKIIQYPIGKTGRDYTVPVGVISVGDDAFHGGSLTNVIFPSSVTSIGNAAFLRCESLFSMIIPDKVIRIGIQAFSDCTNLTRVYFKGNAPILGENSFIGDNSFAFDGDYNATIYYRLGTTGWPVAPNLWGTRPTATWSLPYVLTVTGGSGSGNTYTNQQRVVIVADTPAVGKSFDRWTGSVYVESVTSATTTVTMPAANVAVTATYKNILYALTVIGGSGSSATCTNGQRVTISATVPVGMKFASWNDGDTNTPRIITMPPEPITYTANFTDITKPTVSIKTPIANSKVSNAVCVVSGTATDNKAVASVWVQVNSNGWTQASGTNNWTSMINLAAGLNTIRSYSMDAADNCSPTSSVTCTYVVIGNLTIQTNGSGKITIAPTGVAEVGKSYMLTAAANTGSAFANWTGDNTTTNKAITFVMTSNKTFTANFTDIAKPTVAITAPTALQKVYGTNGDFVVRGTATDNLALSNVMVKVNSGSFVPASPASTNGLKTWTLPVTLTASNNTIVAYSVDTTGNCSVTVTAKCIYVETGTLTITTNGPGKVTVAPTGALELNKTYTLTAAANAGAVFSNWTGDVVVGNPTGKVVKVTLNGTNKVVAVTANFTDTAKPAVIITYPANNAKVMTNDLVIIRGTATDNGVLSEVKYQLRTGDWTNAISTNGLLKTWTADYVPAAGLNTSKVYSVDMQGNHSTTSTVVFTYIPGAVLTVQTNLPAGGTITPSLNGKVLQIGSTNTMTATAKAGYVFTDWTYGIGGLVATNGKVVKFVMQSNLVLTANFRSLTAGDAVAGVLATSQVAITVDGSCKDWTDVPRSAFSYSSTTQEVAVALDGNNIALLLNGCPFSTSDTVLVYFKLRLTYGTADDRHTVDLWTSGSVLYGMVDGQVITGLEAVLLNGVLEVKIPVEQTPSQVTIEEVGCGMTAGEGMMTEIFKITSPPVSTL